MSNGMSEYALEWYLKNPLESPTITFLAVIPGAISNLMVESFPGINEGTKGELSEKLDAYKEHKQDLFESKKEYLIECFKPIASNSEDIIKSIWKDPKIFSQLYRGWKAAMIGLLIPIEIFPGWTPAHTDTEEDYDYVADLREDAQVAKGHERDLEPSPCEFPDNTGPATVAQVHEWVLITFLKCGIEGFAKPANKLIAHTGLTVSYDAAEKKLIYSWASEREFELAEKIYVEVHKEVSKTFKEARDVVGVDVPLWMVGIENLAKRYGKDKSAGGGNQEKLREEIVISEEANSFLDLPSPLYIKLVDDFVIRDMPCDVDSIRIFIHDNDLDETNHDDASFAGICMALVAAGALIPNTSEPETPLVVPNVNDKSSVTAIRIPIWKRSAKRMVDAAFAYASQGARGGDLSWYESYSTVYGRLMRPKRFVEICECILASGFLFEYTRKLTVGNVRSSHNVINYRYKRLSTPDLIFEALRKVENETIYRMVEPEPLREYAKFQRAGVLAQIAAGPLKVYCKGNIDVLTTTDIADEVTISQLKAIDSAPYNSRLIRQAYMILSEYDEVPSNWYQGKKAMREADSKDYIFREVVKAYRASEKKAARELAARVDTKLDEKSQLQDL